MPHEITIPFLTGRVVVLTDVQMDHWDHASLNPFVHKGLHISLDWNVEALLVEGDLCDRWKQTARRAVEALGRFAPPLNSPQIFRRLAW